MKSFDSCALFMIYQHNISSRFFSTRTKIWKNHYQSQLFIFLIIKFYQSYSCSQLVNNIKFALKAFESVKEVEQTSSHLRKWCWAHTKSIPSHQLYQSLSLNRIYLISGPLDTLSFEFYDLAFFRNSQNIYFSQMIKAISLLFYLKGQYCTKVHLKRSHALRCFSLSTFFQSKKCQISYIPMNYSKLFYHSLFDYFNLSCLYWN